MDEVRKSSNSDIYLDCPIIDKKDIIMGIINMVMDNSSILPKGGNQFSKGDKQRLFLLTALDYRS